MSNRNRARADRGASSVEWILVVGLLVVGCIAAWRALTGSNERALAGEGHCIAGAALGDGANCGSGGSGSGASIGDPGASATPGAAADPSDPTREQLQQKQKDACEKLKAATQTMLDWKLALTVIEFIKELAGTGLDLYGMIRGGVVDVAAAVYSIAMGALDGPGGAALETALASPSLANYSMEQVLDMSPFELASKVGIPDHVAWELWRKVHDLQQLVGPLAKWLGRTLLVRDLYKLIKATREMIETGVEWVDGPDVEC